VLEILVVRHDPPTVAAIVWMPNHSLWIPSPGDAHLAIKAKDRILAIMPNVL